MIDFSAMSTLVLGGFERESWCKELLWSDAQSFLCATIIFSIGFQLELF